MLARTGLALALFTPFSTHAQAPPEVSPQDLADLTRVDAYLNGIRALRARFLQIAPNGRESQGTVWLQRPGRMRFQYDPPSPYLLVAGNGILVFHDSQLEQTSNIPLDRTPLGILLAARVTLSGEVTMTGLVRRPGQIQVSLVRTANPAEGSLTLVFNDHPLQLRGWAVVDAQRRETRVSLFDIQLGGSFDQSMFTFVDPHFFGNPNAGHAGPPTGSGGN